MLWNQNAPITAAILLCACAAPTVSLPHELRGRTWLVRGEHLEDVRAVASHLESLAPSIQQRLGGEEVAVEVLLLPSSTPDAAWGQTLSNGVILLEPGAFRDFDLILAHELAHVFLMSRDDWLHLPPIVEEGLADVIAGEVVPGRAFGIQTRHESVLPERGSAQSGRRAIRTVLTEDMYGSDVSEALEVRAIGFVLARRIGVHGLRALCAEARKREHERVPAEWLLDACGVGEEDVGVWERVLRESDPDGWSRFPVPGIRTD